MITITVSFKPDGSNAEVIAQVVKLLSGLENSVAPEPNSDPDANPVEAEVKAAKPRKVRVYTDEQKAAFRARVIAAREAKTKAAGKLVVPARAEDQPVKASKSHGSKKVAKVNRVVTKLSKVSTMPRSGQKAAAKPAAQ